MKKILSIVFVLLSFSARAIVNTESLRPQSKEGWAAAIDLKGQGSHGNTDKALYGANLGAGYFGEQETFFIANYLYGESQRVKDTHRSFAHLRHTEPFSVQNWRWESFFQWQSDEFKRLQSRSLLGLGLRIPWVESKEDWSLWTGVGAFYYQEIIGEEGESRSYLEESGRGNFYVALRSSEKKNPRMVTTLYYQPRVTQLKDYQVLWDLGVYQTLLKNLDFTIEYSLAYDNTPPSQVQRTDGTYLFGLQWKWE